MARHGKKIFGSCAYCETSTRLTKDHPIPQCLYINKKPPADIPYVYACSTCNNTIKNLDDSFLRDFLVMDADSYTHPIAQHIFHEAFLRAANAKKRMQSPLAKQVRNGNGSPVPFYSQEGFYLGEGFGVNIPMERIHRVFSTIVRGLYLYYTGRRLPTGVGVKISRMRAKKESENVIEILMTHGGIHQKAGDGQVFQCVYGVAEDRPDASIWILVFYQRIMFAVETRLPDQNITV